MYYDMVTGIIFGLLGFLVADVLTAPGEVLSFYRRFAAWLFRHEAVSMSDWNFVQWWGYKALYGCAKCVAGFAALLSFIWLPGDFNGMFTRVVVAIFTGWFLNQLHESQRI